MSAWKPLITFRRSLRVDMVIAFGGLLLATVLAIILYFYSNTSRMVWMLCDDIMEQTTRAVIDRTVSFFTPVTALTEMSSRVSAAKVLPCCNSEASERYAVEVLNTYPTVARFNLRSNRQVFCPECSAKRRRLKQRGYNAKSLRKNAAK